MTVGAETATPYDLVGGAPVVRMLVDRFYDLMEQDPAYAELRAMHAADLEPMRESLAGFLIAWLGGPRDWFQQHPGVCVMSAHARLPITAASAGQWTDAMSRAIADVGIEPRLAGEMSKALAAMAGGMARR